MLWKIYASGIGTGGLKNTNADPIQTDSPQPVRLFTTKLPAGEDSMLSNLRPWQCRLFLPFLNFNVSTKGKRMNQDNFIVAIYSSHATAEAAIKELQHSGFEMKKLSIIGRDYHTDEHVVGYYNWGDRMQVWGKTGAFWGGLWGLLFGSAFFWIPGLGPLLVAGPLVGWIVGALEGAIVVGGLSALGAALYSLGIPKDSILSYETAIKTGKFVLIVHGSMDDTTRAKAVLNHTTQETLEHHLQQHLSCQPS